MPTLSKKVDEINKFISEHYRCSYNNVKWLEDARVVCLGENHLSMGHRKANAEVVDAFSFGNNEVVLEESNDGEPRGTPMLKFLPQRSNVALHGWDKISETEVSSQAYTLVATLAWYAFGSSFIKNRTILNVGSFVALLAMINNCYKLQRGSFDRNRHMHEVIQRHANTSSTRKVFVVAGSGHFENSSKIEEKIFGSKMVTEMHESLEQYPSIILIPERKTFVYDKGSYLNLQTAFEIGKIALSVLILYQAPNYEPFSTWINKLHSLA